MHKISAYHWRRPFRRVSYRVCGITAIPDLRAQSGALPAVPALSVVDDVHDEGDEFASRSSGHIGHERVAKERTRAAVVNQKDRKSNTSELQSLMRISYAVFCLTKNNK